MTELPENICRYGKKKHCIRISTFQNPHGYVDYAKNNLQLINKKSNNPLKHGQTLIQTLDKKKTHKTKKQKTKPWYANNKGLQERCSIHQSLGKCNINSHQNEWLKLKILNSALTREWLKLNFKIKKKSKFQ